MEDKQQNINRHSLANNAEDSIRAVPLQTFTVRFSLSAQWTKDNAVCGNRIFCPNLVF